MRRPAVSLLGAIAVTALALLLFDAVEGLLAPRLAQWEYHAAIVGYACGLAAAIWWRRYGNCWGSEGRCR